MRKIETNFWAKPIPARQFDWCAWFDGDEPNDNGSMLCGYGATKEAAIADLHTNADDRSLDLAWERIEERIPTRTNNDFESGESHAYEQALSIIEELGGMDPAKRNKV